MFSSQLGRFTDLRIACILGGDRMEDQFSALHESPDILIATPGRLTHVLVEMELKLKAIQYVVFDEADRSVMEIRYFFAVTYYLISLRFWCWKLNAIYMCT